MRPSSHWRAWGRYVAAAAGAGAISWFAFVAERPVPVVDWIDLGIHELGHLLTFFLPRLLYFMAGSVAQVALPAACAVYFLVRQRDLAGAGFCMAWAGASAWDVSVYIADAPVQALPLVGGGTHDWAYILGPEQLDALGRADAVAGFVSTTGMIVAIAGIGVALWPALAGTARRISRSRRPVARERTEGVRERSPLPRPMPPPGLTGPSTVTPSLPADPWMTASRPPQSARDA